MKLNHLIARAFLSLSALAFVAGAAEASVLYDSGYVTFAPDGTQLGRLSRNGVPSDWSGPSAFPGIVNATTSYSYELFSVYVNDFTFIQVNFDDPSVAFFISAYLGSFNPANLALHYAGDPGLSQPLGNPSFFQIEVAPYTTILLPVNETASRGGTGKTFNILVEGFYDTEYNDVPEPASMALLSGGFGLIAFLRKRRP